jgi:hypothetical protein
MKCVLFLIFIYINVNSYDIESNLRLLKEESTYYKQFSDLSNECGLTGLGKTFNETIMPSSVLSCTDDEKSFCCFVSDSLQNSKCLRANGNWNTTTANDAEKYIKEKYSGSIFKVNCGNKPLPEVGNCGDSDLLNESSCLKEINCCYIKGRHNKTLCLRSDEGKLFPEENNEYFKKVYGDNLVYSDCGLRSWTLPQVNQCGTLVKNKRSSETDLKIYDCQDAVVPCCYVSPSKNFKDSLKPTCMDYLESINNSEFDNKIMKDDIIRRYGYYVDAGEIQCHQIGSQYLNYINSLFLIILIIFF